MPHQISLPACVGSIIICCLVFAAGSCAAGKPSGDASRAKAPGASERAFIEGQLAFIGAESVDNTGRPIKYTLKKDAQYTLVSTAEKYMANVDDMMEMNITLPPQLKLVSGEPHWEGRDKKKELSLVVAVVSTGQGEVGAAAINKANGFRADYRILITAEP